MTAGYDVVVADCNWPEEGGGGRGASEHYEVQSVNTIIGEMQSADAFKGTRWRAGAGRCSTCTRARSSRADRHGEPSSTTTTLCGSTRTAWCCPRNH